MLFGLEQAVQLQGGLFLPVQLQQFLDQCLLLVLAQKSVGQTQIQGVVGIDRCTRSGRGTTPACLAGGQGTSWRPHPDTGRC
ncbi:hypothetical protein PPS11_20753 [Pseudomonas putida S11]|nr:hypothetical protein PPS11_20753 [Pseudomonas putida S11]